MFRQEALDRLSSPEQLDQVMRTTSARGWLFLMVVCVCIGAGIAWGFVGTVSTRVTGHGVLIKSGGVQDVVALGAGQITALYCEAGQDIQKGEIVARIAQPELSEQVEKARARLIEMKAQHEKIASLGTTDTKTLEGYLSLERGTLFSSMKAERERLDFLREQEAQQRDLVARGLVTKQAIEATRAEIRAVTDSIGRSSGQIRGLSVSSGQAQGQKEREMLASELQLSETRREIALLEERLEQTSRVVSPHSGRVLEVRAREGELVSPGRPLITLEPAGTEGSGLEAVLFVPLAQGKQIRPGMRVQIAPDNVKKEEHGVMLGIITSVAEFPSTEDGMKRVLGNDQLVRRLLEDVGLAPIAVQAEIVPDIRTKSGYRWSSGTGPPIQLGPGTPCRANITVERARPIELVVPLLEQSIGV